MTLKRTAAKSKAGRRLAGVPSPKQKLFFAARTKFTAYGGARGGGKSWALRRKLVMLCVKRAGISCLIIRKTYPELHGNHVLPLLAELNGYSKYSALHHRFVFPNGSTITLGYLACDADTLRYQGQEFDIIAIDEATQITEYQFNTLKACLRGANRFPKRMYLTCNPGGVGHAWVKRLFIDRVYNENEKPEEYSFIQALVYDNCAINPDYIDSLKSLPPMLRSAWLEGSWDLFEGQFFSEFNRELHVIKPEAFPRGTRYFAGLDYGFDMLAVVWGALIPGGRFVIYRELCLPNLTLSEAAAETAKYCARESEHIEYIAASPDLWNRRQDSGLSGVEIMAREENLPVLLKADNRRVIGWRCVREYLRPDSGGRPRLAIHFGCSELIRCIPALLHDKTDFEDAAGEPHSITHAPEALRYLLMSLPGAQSEQPDKNFTQPKPAGIFD